MEKIALVTGGSRGIGAATALALAARGWTVHVNYLKFRDKAEAIAAKTGGVAVQTARPWRAWRRSQARWRCW